MSGDNFFGREKQLEILETRVSERHHVLLSGQRYMVKTSITRELGWRFKGNEGFRYWPMSRYCPATKDKSGTLEPLIIVLRQHVGEEIRVPAEFLEVAADLRKRIHRLRDSRPRW